jgi:hypothetical protein
MLNLKPPRHTPTLRIIMARCGDVLTDDDLALVAHPSLLPELLPLEVGDQILAVLSAMAERLDRIEAALAPDASIEA